MKKIAAIIGLVILLLALIIGGIFFLKSRSNRNQEDQDQVKNEKTVEVPLVDRPYATLTPRTDGKEFTLNISNIKETDTIEYELVYLSQGLSRGVVGSIEVEGKSSIERDLLLGTCSKNVCKYDEGVEEGTLTLRFRGDAGNRKFVSDFHLQQNEKELSSVDEQFKVAGSFTTGAYYITMETIGLPGEIDGEVTAGPYGIFTSGSDAVKTATLTFTLETLPENVQVLAWDGKAWVQQEDFEIDSQSIGGSISNLGSFVLITPNTP